MKLVSGIVCFLKNSKPSFFKQGKQPQSASLFTPNTQTAEKQPNKDVATQGADIQMESGSTNIDRARLKQKDSMVSEARKGFFTKQPQQKGLPPTATRPSIIKNTHKNLPQQAELAQLIKVSQLPMELFAIHRQYGHQFTPKNYEHLFVKLHFSTQHPQTVLHYARKKKGLSNQDCNEAKSELRMMTKEEMIVHPEWKDIIVAIVEKMQAVKNIAALNTYLPTFMLLQRAFTFTPAAIYEYVLARNTLADFEELSKEQVSNLIHFLKYNNRLKQTNGLQNDVKQLDEQQSVKVDAFLQRLGQEIINNPKSYSKVDFLNVFIVMNRRKKRMNILTQQLLTKSESSMLQYCPEYSFQNIYTYMKIYVFFHRNPNKQLIDTLVRHLQEKIQTQNNHYALLMALHNFKHGKLVFQNPKEKGTTEQSIVLEAPNLAVRLAKVLSQKMEFNQTQILQLLSYCFHNQITDGQVLQIIQRHIAQKSHIFRLQKLGKALFSLHLLGGKPQKLLRRVLDEYAGRYMAQMHHLKKEEIFSAPSQGNQDTVPSLNFKQIHLQQCLIMLIWTATQYRDCKTVADGLKDIYPSKLNSMDPLFIELALNINHKSLKYKLPQKILYKFTAGVFPEGRLSEFYRHQSTKSQIQAIMWEQAALTGKFVANYNTVAHKFLPQRWSSVSTYKKDEYVSFCLSSSKKSSFFDQHTMLSAEFIRRRQKAIKSFKGGK